jgi:hypothetical protein
MLKAKCGKGMGFRGYCGGLHALIEDQQLLAKNFRADAAALGVLHVGGRWDKESRQYCPKTFFQPIVQAAADGGAKNLYVLLTENFQRRGIPQSGLCGDKDDVLAYLQKYMESPTHPAVYYYSWSPYEADTSVKCFLDLDYHVAEESQEAVMEVVEQTIQTINSALTKSIYGSDDAKIDNEFTKLSIGCAQPRFDEKDSTFKHSFHVTWHNHVFDNMESLKTFLELTFKGSTSPLGEWYDPKVYSRGRALRAPFSRKGDRSTKPPHASESNIIYPHDPMTLGKRTHFHYDTQQFLDFDFSPNPTQQNVHKHSVVIKATNRSVAQIGSTSIDESKFMDTPDYDRSMKMLDFFYPALLNQLVKKIQLHRRDLQRRLGGDGGVPIGSNVRFAKPTYTGKEGCFRIKVIGDTFCQHDAPNHHHSTGDKVAISLNLQQGYYNQLCYACNPRAFELKKYAIFETNNFHVTPFEHGFSSTYLEITGKFGVLLFLWSIGDHIMYHPSFGTTIYVYDDSSRLWVHEHHAIRLLTQMKLFYRQKYNAYCHAATYTKTKALIAGARTEKQAAKIKADFQAFCNKDPTKEVEGKAMMELLVNHYGAAFPDPVDYKNVELNYLPHLVPMNNKQCFDVFTGQCVERTKNMRFTNMLAVSRKESEDDECLEVRKWFLEVSAGRADLAVFLMQLIGYVSTMLVDDRHFYVNHGHGRNGKGVLHKLLKVWALNP